MAAYVGTGLTVTGGSDFNAEILSVSWSGLSRPAIDTTYMGTTTARTFLAGSLYDAGEVTFECALNPGASSTLPVASAAGTLTVTHKDTGAATWAATAFCTGFEWTTPLEERPTCSITYKLSGAITVTP